MKKYEAIIYTLVLLSIVVLSYYFHESRVYYVSGNLTEVKMKVYGNYITLEVKGNNLTLYFSKEAWMNQSLISKTGNPPRLNLNSSSVESLKKLIQERYGNNVQIIAILNASIVENGQKNVTGLLFVINLDKNATKFVLITMDNKTKEIKLPP